MNGLFPIDKYKQLNVIYEDVDEFKSLLNTRKTELTKMLIVDNVPSEFIDYLATLIYEYYFNSQIAYEQQGIFEKRMTYDIFKQLPHLIVKYNMNNWISKLTLQLALQSSKMKSNSVEKGINGSSVLQKSASTPTSINPLPSSNLQGISFTIYPDSVNMITPTDDYVEKYTNYEGKTTGLHKSDIDREGNIDRQGSYKDLIELYKQIPTDFSDEILSIVSKHFIFVC